MDGAPAAAERAAAWLAGFYSDVRVAVATPVIVLSAVDWTESELRAVWKSALANERLHHEAAGHRAGVVRALVE